MSEQKWFDYYVSNIEKLDIDSTAHILTWYLKSKNKPTLDFIKKTVAFGFHPYTLFVIRKTEIITGKVSNSEGWIRYDVEKLDELIKVRYGKYRKLHDETVKLSELKKELTNQLDLIYKEIEEQKGKTKLFDNKIASKLSGLEEEPQVDIALEKKIHTNSIITKSPDSNKSIINVELTLDSLILSIATILVIILVILLNY